MGWPRLRSRPLSSCPPPHLRPGRPSPAHFDVPRVRCTSTMSSSAYHVSACAAWSATTRARVIPPSLWLSMFTRAVGPAGAHFVAHLARNSSFRREACHSRPAFPAPRLRADGTGAHARAMRRGRRCFMRHPQDGRAGSLPSCSAAPRCGRTPCRIAPPLSAGRTTRAGNPGPRAAPPSRPWPATPLRPDRARIHEHRRREVLHAGAGTRGDAVLRKQPRGQHGVMRGGQQQADAQPIARRLRCVHATWPVPAAVGRSCGTPVSTPRYPRIGSPMFRPFPVILRGRMVRSWLPVRFFRTEITCLISPSPS